jgi:hypothetical protein
MKKIKMSKVERLNKKEKAAKSRSNAVDFSPLTAKGSPYKMYGNDSSPLTGGSPLAKYGCSKNHASPIRVDDPPKKGKTIGDLGKEVQYKIYNTKGMGMTPTEKRQLEKDKSFMNYNIKRQKEEAGKKYLTQEQGGKKSDVVISDKQRKYGMKGEYK